MGQYFVLHDARIVVHVYGLDGHRRDLGDERAAERVGDGCVHADQIEFDARRGQALGFQSEALGERRTERQGRLDTEKRSRGLRLTALNVSRFHA